MQATEDPPQIGDGPAGEGGVPPLRRAAISVARAWPLLAVGLVGLVVRWLNVLVWRPTCDYDPAKWTAGGFDLDEGREQIQIVGSSCYEVTGDAVYYFGQGKMLTAGEGYGQAFQWLLFGGDLPSAAHPPVYSTFLWWCNELGLTTVTQQRLASSVVGALGVVLVGVLARRLGGMRAGVLAGLLAAVYPHLWIADGKLLSETFLLPVTALLILATYRFWERPRPRTAVALGLCLGLAQLTRAEMGMLAFLLVGWVAGVLLRRRLPGTTWLTLGLLVFTVAQLAVFPWTVRNLASFTHPVVGSTGLGTVLLSGSCDEAFYGDRMGIYIGCLGEEELDLLLAGADPSQPQLDESEYDKAFRDKAVDYLSDHWTRLPVVAAVRVARIWEIHSPWENAEINGIYEDRGVPESKVGLVLYLAMAPFAAIGVRDLRRRGWPVSPFAVLPIVVTIAVAISFALTRYRLPADVALVVLAGIGIDLAWRWLVRPLGPGDLAVTDGVEPAPSAEREGVVA